MERMIGHNFSRAMIQKFSLVKENSIKFKKIGRIYPTTVKKLEYFYELDHLRNQRDIYDLDKYLYDFENMTVLFANSDKNIIVEDYFYPHILTLFRLNNDIIK